MKLHKLFFTILILFISFQICFGQEKPQAVKIDEFGKIQCDEFLSKMDSLQLAIQYTKGVGYVVIFGDKNNPLEKYNRENLIKSDAVYRRYSDKIIFVHGKDQEYIKTELWLVPVGAEKPSFEEQRWDYSFPENIKPFVLYTKYSYIDDICPPVSDEEFASKLLLANPNMKAHLVIFTNSIKKFNQTKNKLIREYTKIYRIAHNRFKIFNAKKTEYVELEFWLVPKNKHH